MNNGYAHHQINPHPLGYAAGSFSGDAQAIQGKMDPVARQTEVPMLMDRLDSRLAELRDCIEMLERRMEPVVRSSPPVAGQGTSPKEVLNTPVGVALGSMADFVEGMAIRVRDMANRLEV